MQQRLQQLRGKAKPLTQGVAGNGAHRTVQHMMLGLLGAIHALRSLDQAIASLVGGDSHIFEREKQPERKSE